MMEVSVQKTPLQGLLLLTPPVYGDARGSLSETYHAGKFKSLGVASTFAQDNQSVSAPGVLRGLHGQQGHPQAKLVRVLQGEVYDVAVDARYGSKTYGQWYGHRLSGENGVQMYLPEGFLHGFCVLKGPAVVLYKCSTVYEPGNQVGVRWNDPDLAILWPLNDPILSPKDTVLPGFKSQSDTWRSWS